LVEIASDWTRDRPIQFWANDGETGSNPQALIRATGSTGQAGHGTNTLEIYPDQLL